MAGRDALGAADELTSAAAAERSAWAVASALLAVVAVLKGLRLPNLWSATQAQVDYSFGFVKRGLFGEAANLVGLPIAHYTTFGYLSLIILSVVLLLGAWMIWKSGAFFLLDRGAPVALFAASFGLTYLAHLVGYLDIPLLGLVLAALMARGVAMRLAAAIAATAIGILIHESFLLMFFPLLALPLFLDLLAKPQPRREARALAVLCLFAIVLAAAAALERPLSAADLAALQQHIASRVDFSVRADFFEVLGRSAGDNLRIMAAIMRRGYWWRDHAVAAVTALPVIAVFLWTAARYLRASFEGYRRRLALAGVLVAGLAPLSLQFLGWDLYRWYALSVVASFLVMVVTARACAPAGPLALSPRCRVAIAVLIGLNLASGEGLMDGARVAVFPFKSYMPLVQDIAAHGGRLPPPME